MKMKNNIIIAALALAAMVCLCGCSVGFINVNGVRYSDADKYTPGDREFSETIDTLDIDWSSGGVKVTAADVSVVSVKETTKAQLEDELKVHTWAEGSTLHVRFCKSGESYDKNEPKTVEITVPKAAVLEGVNIDVSSADVTCEGLTAKSAALDSSSGNTVFSGSADSFTADSSSGNITFNGEAKKIKADSSSGDITVTQKGKCESISIGTSSGDADIDAQSVNSLTLDTSSGLGSIKLAEMPSDVNIEASSGDMTLRLPETAGFKATISTSSGDVSYELPMTKEGEETYICGDGSSKLSIDTSSGNVKILKL